jgi:hypothetical protein
MFAAPLAFGANVLFSKPLHLVRRIDDPITKTTATLDEYCAGNRVVTVRGQEAVIVDYEAQEVTEINHAAQTWSVTVFADVARARTELTKRMGKSTVPRTAKITAMGRQAANGVDAYVIEESRRKVTIGFNRAISLSRAASEVLMGVAYPNERSAEDDDVLSAAGPKSGNVSAMSTGSAAADGGYGLLVERTLTIESDGKSVVLHNTVLRVSDETPPADAVLIEPGAKRVESRLTRLARELREIDTLPPAKTPH